MSQDVPIDSDENRSDNGSDDGSDTGRQGLSA